MKLIGGWLPFIGYRTEWYPRLDAIEQFGITSMDAPYRMADDTVKLDTFEIEWLGAGITLQVRASTEGKP